jgi:poly-gamma-glutamate synthesis protein (capsule biosynthesis protein)
MRVVACGDALFSSGNLARRLDPAIIGALAQGEATFANAEFICPAHDTPPMPRKYITAVGPGALDELAALRVNLLSFANNHTGDFGPQGVLDTIAACEARGLLYTGMGRSLAEARAARFLDTPKGRIALISASTTRADTMAASPPGNGIASRAGLNPLRWGRAYVLPEEQYGQLQAIDELLGTAASRREVARVEVAPPLPEGRLHFGSFFEGSLQIERGEAPAVRYFANESDAEAILENVRDAANRADLVLLSLHCHEGADENWYAPRPAAFIEDFARRAIDAGAHAFLGHGPHMLRGVEFYRGRPIFYSLGSLMMEFESGEQRMSPEMYEGYGLSRDALPYQLHGGRVHDAAGDWIGFYGDPRFSRAVFATIDFKEGSAQVQLLPVDLDLRRIPSHTRGLPYPASPDLARAIADDMAVMSAPYGTKVAFDQATCTIAVAPG